MSCDPDFDAKIALEKNKCIVNIMKCYQTQMYGIDKRINSIQNKKKDNIMLNTIIKEIDGLFQKLFV
jgi:hypothetical protein